MIVLDDRNTGCEVHLDTARHTSLCPICRKPMLGLPICHVVGHSRGWVCVEHLERLLLTVPPARLPGRTG
jgi:hypothetical protein